MTFLNPLALWGMLGVLIPIAIHLLSRKEGTVIYVGSLRHFEDSPTQRFKSIRLNEWLLLLLRILLIALLVLLISDLRIRTNTRSRWVLVEPGLDLSNTVSRSIDSLVDAGFERRVLAESFPEDDPTVAKPTNYWKLIEELGDNPVQQAVVFAKGSLNGFTGARASRPPAVSWIQVNDENETEWLGIRYTPDSIRVFRSAVSHGNSILEAADTPAYVSGTDTLDVLERRPLRIFVAHDDKRSHDRELLLSALEAIRVTEKVKLRWANDTDTESADWCFMFGSAPAAIPCTNRVELSDEETDIRVEKVSANGWRISGRLTPERMLDQHVVIRLAELLLSDERGFIASRQVQPVLDECMIWAAQADQSETAPGLYDPSRLLMAAFVLLLIVERAISFIRMA